VLTLLNPNTFASFVRTKASSKEILLHVDALVSNLKGYHELFVIVSNEHNKNCKTLQQICRLDSTSSNTNNLKFLMTIQQENVFIGFLLSFASIG
jgi:hypothetical protein